MVPIHPRHSSIKSKIQLYTIQPKYNAKFRDAVLQHTTVTYGNYTSETKFCTIPPKYKAGINNQNTVVYHTTKYKAKQTGYSFIPFYTIQAKDDTKDFRHCVVCINNSTKIK